MRKMRSFAAAIAVDESPLSSALTKKIRLRQDLIVDAVHAGVGVMMRHDMRNARDIHPRKKRLCEKCRNERRTLPLLMLSVGVAVFLAAKRTGNIVHHRCQLRCFRRVRVESLPLADGLGKRPDLEKMVDVIQIAVIKGNHFFHCGCDHRFYVRNIVCFRIFRNKKRTKNVKKLRSSY